MSLPSHTPSVIGGLAAGSLSSVGGGVAPLLGGLGSPGLLEPSSIIAELLSVAGSSP